MKDESAVKYPKNEIVWELYTSTDGKPQFLITSKVMRDFYYLYEFQENKLVKLGKAPSPTELEKKFNILKRIGASE